MTREEAVKEIKKAFEPAFANYIITALIEGATVSDKEPTTKNDLVVDCIDRQAAITFVCKNTKEILKDTMSLEVKLSDDYLYENVAKIMRNPKVLPSVTPQEPRWIPVTEKLPGESTAVLVWCPERKNIYCAYYEEKCWWIFGACFAQLTKVTSKVIAWMPLPQPYEAESEGEEWED